MLTINLLPDDVRSARKKKKLNLKVNLAAIMIGIGCAALLVVFHLGLIGYNVYLNGRLSKLEVDFMAIKPDAEKISEIKKLTERLIRKKNIVQDLLGNRILWSKKMNQLSDIIPNQVWLTSLETEVKTEQIVQKQKMPDGTTIEKIVPRQYKVMVYEGGVISMERREMLYLIGDFIASIKKKDDFYELFRDIELVKTEREKDKDTGREYMKFELSSRFKD